MNPNIQRGLMLFQQGRFEQAEEEIRLALVSDPDDATGHAILALCLTKRGRYKESLAESQQAIHLAPNDPFMLYVHSQVLFSQNQFKEAKRAIQNAIEMQPANSQYFAMLAQIEFALEQWPKCLQASEEGLALDPEDVECTNFRAMALIKLGRSSDAQDTLGGALQRAPDDALSHANMGWSSLEKNEPQQAMEHFREALRLEPDMEWARRGIVEAMKARFFIYRIMLNWFLWMNKLQQNARFGIIVGAYIGYQVLASVARNNPQMAVFLRPFLALYLSFVVMTWISVPLFNLILRTSRFGRLALSEEETRTSNRMAICLIAAIAMLGFYFATGHDRFLAAALACGLCIPPITMLYACSPGWPRAVMTTLGIGLVGTASFITTCVLLGYFVANEYGKIVSAVGVVVLMPFVISAVATQFGSMFLTSVTPTKGDDSGRIAWIIGIVALTLLACFLLGFLGLGLLAVYLESAEAIDVAEPVP
ncbi:MAG: tetratricopeptide repeat protein [Planctomycetota bacterium]